MPELTDLTSDEALAALREKLTNVEPNKEYIYVRYDMKADSYSAIPTPLSYHKTLEGAVQAIPEDFRKQYGRGAYENLYGNVVADYRYEAVRRVMLLA